MSICVMCGQDLAEGSTWCVQCGTDQLSDLPAVRGCHLLRGGQAAEALALFEEGLQQIAGPLRHSRDAAALWALKGRALQQLGKPVEAAACWAESMEADSTYRAPDWPTLDTSAATVKTSANTSDRPSGWGSLDQQSLEPDLSKYEVAAPVVEEPPPAPARTLPIGRRPPGDALPPPDKVSRPANLYDAPLAAKSDVPHGLSIPVASKVIRGSMDDAAITLECSDGAHKLGWDEVVCTYLGKVDSSAKHVDGEGARTSGGALPGSNKKPGGAEFKQSAYFLLDIYQRQHDRPFRVDPTGTNLRSFLGADAGFSAEINLSAFVNRLATHLIGSAGSGVAQFLERGKGAVPTSSSRENFADASYRAFRAVTE